MPKNHKVSRKQKGIPLTRKHHSPVSGLTLTSEQRHFYLKSSPFHPFLFLE